MQAATVEVGTSLVNTVTAAGGKDGKTAGDQAKKGPVPEPVKMVGGIGMELLRVSEPDHFPARLSRSKVQDYLNTEITVPRQTVGRQRNTTGGRCVEHVTGTSDLQLSASPRVCHNSISICLEDDL